MTDSDVVSLVAASSLTDSATTSMDTVSLVSLSLSSI